MNESDTSEQKLWFDSILHLDDDGNIIPATPTQIDFIKMYGELISSVLIPRAAAGKIQRMVKSLSDHGTINGYSYALGLLRRGWFMLSCHQSLAKLADFTIETAKLPETVELIDGEQWPPLLELKRALNDGLQSLEFYLPVESSVDPTVARQVAERQWANINTFCAMLLCRNPTGETDALSQCGHEHCWFTIVGALETSSEALPDSLPRNRLEKYKVWAAGVWFTLAGSVLIELRDRSWGPGPLWTAEGGDESITTERWRFWQRRFSKLADSRQLSVEATKEAREAARTISSVLSF
ncbi:hypothetical protein KCU98_g4352, partial [Aureobasidium melanogenum]